MPFGISSALMKYSERQTKQIARLKARSEHCLITLSPEFRRRIVVIIRKLEKDGAIPVVYWGKRTLEQQQEIVKAGHSPGVKSWHIPQHHRNYYHNGIGYTIYGEAADIVDARFLWQGPCADLNHPFWAALGKYAKEEGLEWGGDWKPPIKRDVAHVQLKKLLFVQDTRGSVA